MFPEWHSGKEANRDNRQEDRQKIFHKVMTELAEGKYFKIPVGSKKTVTEMIDKYLGDHSKPNLAASSHNGNLYLAKGFKAFFGDMLVSDVTANDIADYKKKRRDKGAMGITINNGLRLLSHMFKLAVDEWGWLTANPHGVDIYKVKKLMRHKSPQSTQRYAHHNSESLWSGVEVLDVLPSTKLSQSDCNDAA
jgi:integrase